MASYWSTDFQHAILVTAWRNRIKESEYENQYEYENDRSENTALSARAVRGSHDPALLPDRQVSFLRIIS
jgi:hypothetical protein